MKVGLVGLFPIMGLWTADLSIGPGFRKWGLLIFGTQGPDLEGPDLRVVVAVFEW
jgi:hypothetical protein